MHALESDYLGKMFHQYTGFSSTGSLFPNKLYRMLTDKTCLCMYWGGDGTHLVINTREFEDELLEDTSLRWKYQLKTTSTTSFIRQLHAYGFKKVLDDLEKFGPDPNYIRRYYHPCFQEKRAELLTFMKRNVRVSSGPRKRQLLHHQQEMQQMHGGGNSSMQLLHDIKHFDINPFIPPPQFTSTTTSALPNGFYQCPPPAAMFMSKETTSAQQQQQQQGDDEECATDSSNSRKNRRKAQPRRHPSFDVRFGQGDGNAMSTSFPFGFKAHVKSELVGAGSSLLDSVVDGQMCIDGPRQDPFTHTSSSPSCKRPPANHQSVVGQQPLDLSSPVAKKAALMNKEVEEKGNEQKSSSKPTPPTFQHNYKNIEKRRMSCPSPAQTTSPQLDSSAPSAAISCNISTPFAGNLPPRVQVPYGTMLQPAYIAWTTRKIYSAEHKRWIQARPSIIPLPMKPVAPESCSNFNFHSPSNTVSAEKLVENFPHFPVSYSAAPPNQSNAPTTSSSSSATSLSEKTTIDDCDVTTTAATSSK